MADENFVPVDSAWLLPNARTGISVRFKAENFAYHDALARCFRPSCASFPDYGARGIVVCDRWRYGENGMSGFKCFMEDMGARPAPNLSLDRIDNAGNYEPGNCRWATIAEQRLNQRPPKKGKRVRRITIDGVTLGLAEWCRQKNIKASVVAYRLRKGWTRERAITEPA